MGETSEGPRVERTGSSVLGRVKESVDKFVHKHLTVEGRADTIRAERHYDQILANMSPEDRMRAEPIFEMQARKAALGTVVRDIGVTAVALGGAAVGYKYRREIGGAVENVAKGAWSKLPEGIQHKGVSIAEKAKVNTTRLRETVVKPINEAGMKLEPRIAPIREKVKGATDKLEGFLKGIKAGTIDKIKFRKPPAPPAP